MTTTATNNMPKSVCPICGKPYPLNVYVRHTQLCAVLPEARVLVDAFLNDPSVVYMNDLYSMFPAGYKAVKNRLVEGLVAVGVDPDISRLLSAKRQRLRRVKQQRYGQTCKACTILLSHAPSGHDGYCGWCCKDGFADRRFIADIWAGDAEEPEPAAAAEERPIASPPPAPHRSVTSRIAESVIAKIAIN